MKNSVAECFSFISATPITYRNKKQASEKKDLFWLTSADYSPPLWGNRGSRSLKHPVTLTDEQGEMKYMLAYLLAF